VLLLILRQGAEKQIDGQAQSARCRRLKQVQKTVQNGHIPVRRNHINSVPQDLRAILDLGDFHRRGALEQLGHDALVRRVQVLDDDKRHAAALRHVSQKLLDGLESPRGGADADDGKRHVARRSDTFSRTAVRTFSAGISVGFLFS